jgi:spore maturation protein CgeB
MSKRVILVGIPKATHVGLHLKNAAPAAGMEMSVLNMEEAFAGPRLLRALYWRLFGHRPMHLIKFSARLVERCWAEKPDFVLTTGLAPVNEAALKQIAEMGIPVVNFLTDDPWNPAHRAPWFMRALPHYAHVFSPRHANLPDLVAHGVKAASYLPFAYAPEEHHPPKLLSEADHQRWGHLVAFIGGADPDRAAIIRSLVQNEIPVGLWGGYWNRYPDLAPYAHGHADAETCRRIVAAAGANLCLVRKANRDGHSMRSYEMAAIGGCLLVEDTPDHRRLFGEDDKAAYRFDSSETLVNQARHLLGLPIPQRQAMATLARQRVVTAGHTYADRLQRIGSIVASSQ